MQEPQHPQRKPRSARAARLTVIANGSSGTGAGHDELRRELRRLLHGAPPSEGPDGPSNSTAGTGDTDHGRPSLGAYLACVPPDKLSDAARRAAQQGHRLVAAGGDGTVATVAAQAVEHGAELAVLPRGTLNHFAKDVGIPLDQPEAARLAQHGQARAFDVASANGRVFVNNLSIGAYPKALRVRRRIGRRWRRKAAVAGTPRKPGRLRKAGQTLRASWGVLWRLPRHHIGLEIDGHPVRRVASLVFVGNNAYTLTPAGFGSRERLDAGELGLVVVRATTPGQVLRLAGRALLGRLDRSKAFEAVACKRIVIGADRPGREVLAAMDGEPVTLRTPIVVETLPKALRVVAP